MIDTPRITVQVQSVYAASQSLPEEARFVFAYTVTLRNLGRFNVQLLRRYWLITNGNGRQTEVQGEGVIGEQPLILPSGEFQYTSGAIIETPAEPWRALRNGRPPRSDLPYCHPGIPSSHPESD